MQARVTVKIYSGVENQLTGIDWSRRAVAQCARLHPYMPGKPMEQLLKEKGLASAIKLASNENPYGLSPRAIEAIRGHAGEVYRYPDGNAGALKTVLADKHAVRPENILLGNGSNEVLELMIRTFAGPGDEVVYSEHAFIVYALATVAAGANGVAVPEADGLSHDLDAMARAVSDRTKVVCMANPNNPTGTLHDLPAIQAFLDGLSRHVVVVLDEAYYEYTSATIGDSIGRLSHPGLVICRTFSKAYGLAGLRVGYGVGDADMLALVNRFREPFNVNLLAQKAAIAALDDTDWVREKVAITLDEREKLQDFLEAHHLLGGKSHGNFVLLRHPRSMDILQALENRGIIPRPLAPYGMPEYLRITVGAMKENTQFMMATSEIMRDIQ